MTLIDTNVLVDVLAEDPAWIDWSVEQLRRQREAGPLSINEIVYAELAVRFQTESELNAALVEFGIRLERTPTPALFVAAKAFHRYRTAGGPRSSILPDFFIGAHAEVEGLSILTRDTRRYRSYFPEVELIAPA
jgi:predicted nucleic acid-binding protein